MCVATLLIDRIATTQYQLDRLLPLYAAIRSNEQLTEKQRGDFADIVCEMKGRIILDKKELAEYEKNAVPSEITCSEEEAWMEDAESDLRTILPESLFPRVTEHGGVTVMEHRNGCYSYL